MNQQRLHATTEGHQLLLDRALRYILPRSCRLSVQPQNVWQATLKLKGCPVFISLDRLTNTVEVKPSRNSERRWRSKQNDGLPLAALDHALLTGLRSQKSRKEFERLISAPPSEPCQPLPQAYIEDYPEFCRVVRECQTQRPAWCTTAADYLTALQRHFESAGPEHCRLNPIRVERQPYTDGQPLAFHFVRAAPEGFYFRLAAS